MLLHSKIVAFRVNSYKSQKITYLEGGANKPVDGEKTIFIQADNKQRVQITFEISDEDNLTCGWLVSETIRQFANNNIQEPYPNRPIVALQTLDNIITLDYWLSESERSVSVLKDRMVLKPYYGDNDYLITTQKINLQFFHILKVIGTGGFSKVYLGKKIFFQKIFSFPSSKKKG